MVSMTDATHGGRMTDSTMSIAFGGRMTDSTMSIALGYGRDALVDALFLVGTVPPLVATCPTRRCPGRLARNRIPLEAAPAGSRTRWLPVRRNGPH